jgi:hypothetical protein
MSFLPLLEMRFDMRNHLISFMIVGRHRHALDHVQHDAIPDCPDASQSLIDSSNVSMSSRENFEVSSLIFVIPFTLVKAVALALQNWIRRA